MTEILKQNSKNCLFRFRQYEEKAYEKNIIKRQYHENEITTWTNHANGLVNWHVLQEQAGTVCMSYDMLL